MDRATRLVTIFGGSGFVGTQLVQRLARQGYRMRIAVRRPDLALHLKPLGAVGQIAPIQANLRNPASVQRAVSGADVVINLVGVGFERQRQRFRAVHVEGAAAVAEAARTAGAKALVHMSALGADPDSRSAYARSKAMGEAAVLSAFPGAVVIRPSIMFGPADDFFNLIGGLARMLPVLPLIGGTTRFQPVYVGDVAEACVRAAEGEVEGGRIYELGGPEVRTHRELVQLVLRETRRTNPLLAVPAGLAKVMALPFALLPIPPLLTFDQVELLHIDNVVSSSAIDDDRTFAAFGIEPVALEAILPSYLWRFMKHGQFDRQAA